MALSNTITSSTCSESSEYESNLCSDEHCLFKQEWNKACKKDSGLYGIWTHDRVLSSTNWVDSQMVAGPYVGWKSSCKDLFALRSTSKKFNHLQYQVQKMFIFLKTSHNNVANYRCELISIVTVDPTVFQYLSYLLHMSRDHNKIAIRETQHYVAITKPVKK